jgi:hypothetical protein
MATYLKGGVDYFPQETLFTPDYSLIQQTLQYKQGQYDKGFAQVNKNARNIIDSEMSSVYAKDKRKEILSNAEQALKNLPNIDLSLPQNVGAANSIFQPFYEDEGILGDIMKTKSLKSEIQKGMSLRDSDKEDQRKRYWNIGVQDLYDNLEDLSKATDPQQIASLRTRRFVGKPQVSDQILKMFSDGKLKTSYDYLSGQYKYTNENGQEIKDPLTNMFLSMAENDPEAMDGYSTIGRVKRRRYINERSDVLGSPEAATKEHDDALLADYFNTQNKIYTTTSDAMQSLGVKLNAWKSKADAGQLIAGSEDEQKAINDQKVYDGLKLRADKIRSDIFSVDNKPAPYISRIGNNPTAYLGLLELNKDAIDLATSLSQFGTRKVDINPVWEKAVLPLQLEDFKTQKQKELEAFKTNEDLRKTKGGYDLKLEYGIPLFGTGSGDGTGDGTNTGKGAKATLGQLNIPVVEDNPGGSTVGAKDVNGRPDVHTEIENKSNEIIGDLQNTKLQFIEAVLDPTEIKTADGKFIPYDERRSLSTKPSTAAINVPSGPITPEEESISAQTGESPYVRRKRLASANSFIGSGTAPASTGTETELERLYALAQQKHAAQNTAGVHDTNWQRAVDLSNQVQVKDNNWTAAIQFKKEKYKELVGNMASSDPKQGFVYSSLFDGMSLVNSPEEFVRNLQKNPGFAQEVQAETNRLVNNQVKTSKAWGYQYDPRQNGDFANQALSNVTEKYRNNYEKYRNNIGLEWNKAGNEWNYFSTNQQKGSGIYSKAITFTGSTSVTGEKADVYTSDLLTMLSKYQTASGFDNNVVKIDFGGSKIKGEGDNPKDSDIPNNSDAVSAFEKLKPVLRNAIKPGGSQSEMDVYTITANKVAANNPNWSSYTIIPQPKLITENTSTETSTKLLTPDEAKVLGKGITIYVRKENDNSQFSRATTPGEVELLLNANKGLLNTEVAPGYTIQIATNSTGNYKITSNYIDVGNVNGVATDIPKTITTEVPKDADLTQAYYQILSGLTTQVYQNVDAKKRLTSSNTNPAAQKVDWNTIVGKAKQ